MIQQPGMLNKPKDRVAGANAMLGVVATDLERDFLEAGSALESSLRVIDRTISDFSALVPELAGDASDATIDTLARIALRIENLPDTQTMRLSRLNNAMNARRTLDGHVRDMAQSLRMLRAYGLNIKIAAGGDGRFGLFVDDMFAHLAVGSGQLDGVTAGLADLSEQVVQARTILSHLLAECRTIIPDVPRRLREDAAAFASYVATMGDLARDIEAIAHRIQQRVGTVLGAMQIGDTTRQRIEHIVQTCDIMAGHDTHPAAVRLVRHLLTAQLHALRDDFGQGSDTLGAALEQIEVDARMLMRLTGPDDREPGRTQPANARDGHAILHHLDDSMTHMAHVTTQLRDADRHSRQMETSIETIIATVTDGVARLKAMQGDMHNIAINTRLLCRHPGATERAVSVVASEIDICVNSLDDAGTGMTNAVMTLGVDPGTAAGAAVAPEEDIGDLLGRISTRIRNACRHAEDAMARGRVDLQELSGLVAATKTTMTLTDRLLAAVDAAIDAFADDGQGGCGQTDLPAPALADLKELLPSIRRLYTMASEREVHAACIPPGIDDTAASQPADPFDDLDDGLF